MNTAQLSELITSLRESGSDSYRIEAKEASSDLPRTIDESLSAFGNMPEGGLLILGIAETGGACDVTGVWNAKAAQGALGSKAR